MAKKIKKVVKKVAKKDPELEKLIAVAEDMNSCKELDLDPPFDTEGLSVEELKDQLSDSEVLKSIKASMKLSAETFDVLKELGWKETSKKSSKKVAPVEDEEEEETEEPVEKSKASKKEVKKAVKKESSGKKGPGVIDSIIAILKKAPKGGVSVSSIVEKLAAIFPDREADKMIATVKVQCSGRLKNERGLNVTSPEKGMYRIA